MGQAQTHPLEEEAKHTLQDQSTTYYQFRRQSQRFLHRMVRDFRASLPPLACPNYQMWANRSGICSGNAALAVFLIPHLARLKDPSDFYWRCVFQEIPMYVSNLETLYLLQMYRVELLQFLRHVLITHTVVECTSFLQMHSKLVVHFGRYWNWRLPTKPYFSRGQEPSDVFQLLMMIFFDSKYEILEFDYPVLTRPLHLFQVKGGSLVENSPWHLLYKRLGHGFAELKSLYLRQFQGNPLVDRQFTQEILLHPEKESKPVFFHNGLFRDDYVMRPQQALGWPMPQRDDYICGLMFTITLGWPTFGRGHAIALVKCEGEWYLSCDNCLPSLIPIWTYLSRTMQTAFLPSEQTFRNMMYLMQLIGRIQMVVYYDSEKEFPFVTPAAESLSDHLDTYESNLNLILLLQKVKDHVVLELKPHLSFEHRSVLEEEFLNKGYFVRVNGDRMEVQRFFSISQDLSHCTPPLGVVPLKLEHLIISKENDTLKITSIPCREADEYTITQFFRFVFQCVRAIQSTIQSSLELSNMFRSHRIRVEWTFRGTGEFSQRNWLVPWMVQNDELVQVPFSGVFNPHDFPHVVQEGETLRSTTTSKTAVLVDQPPHESYFQLFFLREGRSLSIGYYLLQNTKREWEEALGYLIQYVTQWVGIAEQMLEETEEGHFILMLFVHPLITEPMATYINLSQLLVDPLPVLPKKRQRV